ncbi:MAG: anti-virulence regulator CigR family protein [Parvibaculum sp.]|uniref:anti-virulence regulator CigR family protein n=1 Tax=Parvibaculum sp. TaxID=2024848 RepID=UPI0032EDF3C7
MRTKLLVLGLTFAVALPGAVLAGNGNGKGPPPGKGGGVGSETEIGVEVAVSFAPDEVRIIRDYFSTTPAEVKPLPPGIAKNLARGKPLPPGIAKRYLPRDLSSRLPVRADCERLIAGDDVLLVSLATGVIVDILTDAL